MNNLRSFINCEVAKEQLLASLHAHKLADNFIKGKYWKNGKGCAVGCSIRDFKPGNESIHSLYESLFGLPRGLALLEDHIFERSSDAYAKTWPIRLIEAIPVGSDLAMVAPKLQRFILTEIVKYDSEQYPNVKVAVDAVVGLIDREIAGDEPTQEEWSAARSAAESAARSAAESAARPAAWSAAESAARPAAWSAAWSAAWFAGCSAGWCAARPAAVERIGDELIRLLEETK